MIENSNLENIPLEDRYNTDKIIGEDADELSYERMPVSSFGMCMLQSMGFYEGRGLGKNPENALHHPIEFVPRHHRQGLGADPKPSFLQKAKNKENPQLIGGFKDNGKVKNYINIGDKLIEKKKKVFERNVDVKIIKGKHENLIGKILNVNESEKECIIELAINEESVKAKFDELAFIEENDGGEIHSNGKSELLHKAIKKEKKPELDSHKKGLKWVVPNIRVRIISKKVNNGKHYNMKVVITDILDACTFSALTNKGDSINNLREKDIETLLPELEKFVMVVRGKNKGKTALLKVRDKTKNKVIIQYTENFEYEEMTQDDVCEYVN